MLRNRIEDGIKKAMKAKDVTRLEALRYLWSLIKNAEIDAKRELEDEQVVRLVQSEVKKRREAIEQIKKGGREELVKEEQAKLRVLQEFLPEQMSEAEISELVNQVISESGEKEFGVIMGEVMKRVAGRAEGKMVSEMVRRKLETKASD